MFSPQFDRKSMSDVPEEVIQAISEAISEAIYVSDSNMLPTIDAAEENWQLQLDEAKSSGRKQLEELLEEREALRESLENAADLWTVLQLTSVPGPNRFNNDADSRHSANFTDQFPADPTDVSVVKGLDNISQTLFWAEFIMAAPNALAQATVALEKIQSDGLITIVKGNPAALVDAHSHLTAAERLRDLILLESFTSIDKSTSANWLSSAAETRELLENILIQGIFHNVVPLSKTNPCMLVAGARVVEYEEAEDEWWKTHIQRCGLHDGGATIRPFESRSYKKRALNAVIESLQNQFKQKERELKTSPERLSQGDNVKTLLPKSKPHLSAVFKWIEQRRTENEVVRRFVTPCLPPSFAVAQMYERELHRQFTRLIHLLIHLNNADGSMLLSESDLLKLISWYSKYREEVGQQDETVDSFLSEKDRMRLLTALRRHCSGAIMSSIASKLAEDGSSTKNQQIANSNMSARPFELLLKKSVLCRKELPEIIMESVSEQVRQMLDLKMRGVDQAVSQVVAELLLDFQSGIREQIGNDTTDSKGQSSFLCMIANHMGKCLGYAEVLRDVFIPLALDNHRPDIEEGMECVIEGFRSTASVALQVLIDRMKSSLEVHADRLFAPRSGTEVVLDMLATVEDYFEEYRESLLDYHMEYLAIETLKRIVVWYLVPFMRLPESRIDESVARRFTSLPIFKEDKDEEVGEFSDESFGKSTYLRRVDTTERGEISSSGLTSMSRAAVIALIDKDIANMSSFMERNISLHQKKQMNPNLEPLHAMRSLYACNATPNAMAEAFEDSKLVLSRAVRHDWVTEYCGQCQFEVKTAQRIWMARTDTSAASILEAVTLCRNAGRFENTTAACKRVVCTVRSEGA